MALILAPTQQKTIKVQGTEITLNSAYLRVEFKARLDGVIMDLNAVSYLNKDMYRANSPVVLDIASPQISVSIDPLTSTQGIDSAHAALKSYFEANGYSVTIDLS